MKQIILKLSTVILLFAFISAGCQKDEFSDTVEGYIVGSFICDETDGENGQATGNNTERGFCILLKNSENANKNWPMDFYTFDIPSDLFDFPDEIIVSTHNSMNCGPAFFRDSLQTSFKIEFEYRRLSNTDKVHFACGPCTAMNLTFSWENYKQVVFKNIKITK